MNSGQIKSTLQYYSAGGLTESTIREATTPDKGPNVTLHNFNMEGQSGEYHHASNTIRLDPNLVKQYETIMSHPKATIDAKKAIAITLTSTFLNELTHYGDALDGKDAILDNNGKVVNGPFEGGMINQYDEGNAAAESLYPFVPMSTSRRDRIESGLQNLNLRAKGQFTTPYKLQGTDEDEIDETLFLL